MEEIKGKNLIFKIMFIYIVELTQNKKKKRS